MKKYIAIFLLFLAGCADHRKQLNVLIWANYIDPKIVADFEHQFDCKVVFDSFDNDAAVIPKLAAGGASLYDIVCLGNHIVPALAQQGLLASLRHENLPNFKNLAPDFINLAFDPGNRFSVPYQWGTAGLYVRTATNSPPPDQSWGLIFDPAKQVGPFALIDEMKTTLGIALRYKGYSVNSTNLAELAEARDLLIQTKKRSLGLRSGQNIGSLVFNGEAKVVVAWTGRTVENLKQNPGVVFFIPREGAGLGIDSLAIPSRAPHRDLAEQFLNYLLDAKVAAQTASFLGEATVNKAALDSLATGMRNNPIIYPPADVMQRLEVIKDLGEMTKLHDEIWTQIKSN